MVDLRVPTGCGAVSTSYQRAGAYLLSARIGGTCVMLATRSKRKLGHGYGKAKPSPNLGRHVKCQIVFWSVTTMLLAGCVAGDVAVTPARKASVREIAVHAVEAPPLIVPSAFPLGMESTAVFGQTLGELGIVIGGVVMLARAGAFSAEAKKFAGYASDLEADQIWAPTAVVAQQVVSHLQDRNGYQVQTLLPIAKLFGRDDEVWIDEYGPIRQWYNGDEPAPGTRSAESDIVIEAGIWSYELAQGLFALAVVLRAVDPETGEVLGRARAIGLPPARDVESLFANDAHKFKALFTDTSDRLTKQALDQLGF